MPPKDPAATHPVPFGAPQQSQT